MGLSGRLKGNKSSVFYVQFKIMKLNKPVVYISGPLGLDPAAWK